MIARRGATSRFDPVMARCASLLPLLFLLAPASGVAVADDAETKTARITYLSISDVYINAGQDEGLREGDRIEVMREGKVVAVLEVNYLSPHRASCRVVESEASLRVGDSVSYHPRPAVQSGAEPPPDSGPAEAVPAGETSSYRSGLSDAGIHGRVSVRYLFANDRSGRDSGYSQPSFDLRLDGDRIGGSDWGMAVDVRARRTTQSVGNGQEIVDEGARVYRMAASWQSDEIPLRITLGRQFSPALSTVSIFDGLSADFLSARWSAGVLTGTQPYTLQTGGSSDIREHGAYFQWRSRPAAVRRWTITSGLIGSYANSEVNREFFYLQGFYSGPKLSLFATQEIDYNRSWKESAGEDTFSSTNSFISLLYRMTELVDFRAGYDDRRNPRLYRDRLTPVAAFDATYREGVWAGTSVRIARRWRVGLDYRASSGENAGDADSYTITLGASGLTRRAVGFNLRSTRYENPRLEGWIHSLSASLAISARISMGLFAGLRDEENLQIAGVENSVTWFGIEFEVPFDRHWFLLISAEHSEGDFSEIDQGYLALSCRF